MRLAAGSWTCEPFEASRSSRPNDLLKRVGENQERLLRLVEGLSESDVEKHEQKLRFLVHHELSHAGQIALLKKSRSP